MIVYDISHFSPFLPLTSLPQRLPERKLCHDTSFSCLSWAGYPMCFKLIPELLCLIWLQDELNSVSSATRQKVSSRHARDFIVILYIFNIYTNKIHIYIWDIYIQNYFSSLEEKRKSVFLQDRSDSTGMTDLLIGKNVMGFFVVVETQALKGMKK